MEHEFNNKELLDSLSFSGHVSNCYGLYLDIWRLQQPHCFSEKESEMRSNSAAKYKCMTVDLVHTTLDQNRPQTDSVVQSKKLILHFCFWMHKFNYGDVFYLDIYIQTHYL